jgi:hypothetical protein
MMQREEGGSDINEVSMYRGMFCPVYISGLT